MKYLKEMKNTKKLGDDDDNKNSENDDKSDDDNKNDKDKNKDDDEKTTELDNNMNDEDLIISNIKNVHQTPNQENSVNIMVNKEAKDNADLNKSIKDKKDYVEKKNIKGRTSKFSESQKNKDNKINVDKINDSKTNLDKDNDNKINLEDDINGFVDFTISKESNIKKKAIDLDSNINIESINLGDDKKVKDGASIFGGLDNFINN